MSKAKRQTAKQIEKTEIAEIKKLTEEVKADMDDPYLGIDTDRLLAYVDHKRIKWRIRPDGHVRSVRNQIIEASDKFKKQSEAYEKRPDATLKEKEDIYELATKTVLELALVDFSYDEWADKAEAGPGVLGLLANEIVSFLVERGGREGDRRLQTLQRLNILSHSRTLMDSPKNGKSIGAPDMESDPS